MPSNNKGKSRKQSKSKTPSNGGAHFTDDLPLQLATKLPKTELKYYDSSTENLQLYHNTPVVFGGELLQQITSGAGVGNRIGNIIGLRGVDVRVWLSNKLDRPNVMYRVSLFMRSFSTSADTPSEFMSGGNSITALFKHEAVRLLHDHVVNPVVGFRATNSSVATGTDKEHSWFYSFKCPVDLGISYPTSTGSPLVALFLQVVAYDAYGTLTTDNIGSYGGIVRMTYKDS